MFLSDAGAVGLNLQRAATACINLELPWNPAVLEQRVGRIYRLGQTQPIDVFNLITEYGIESRIAGLIGSKEALFTGLFDGTTDSVRFDAPSGFLKNIERLVERVEVPPLADDTEGSVEDPVEDADADATLPPAAASPAEATALAAALPAEAAAPAEAPLRAEAPLPAEMPPLPARSEPSSAVPSAVDTLFQRITVTRTETGALRLEAPPEAAEELARLLQGFAALLGAASRAPAEEKRG